MRFEKHGVDVPFQMIHADQRLPERLRQHLAVGHADEQRADQPWPVRDGHGVHIFQRQVRLLDRFPHHRHDLPKVLARRKLRHHAAVLAMNLGLRRDYARKNSPAAGDDRRGRLVAGGFNTENQCIRLRSQPCLNLRSDSKSLC